MAGQGMRRKDHDAAVDASNAQIRRCITWIRNMRVYVVLYVVRLARLRCDHINRCRVSIVSGTLSCGVHDSLPT